MSNVLGLRIALARKNRGWSQTRLAEKVNQAQTTISSWERGRTEPSRSDVRRIAQVLDIDVAELEVGVILALTNLGKPAGQIVFRDIVQSVPSPNVSHGLGNIGDNAFPVGLRIGDGAIARKLSGWTAFYYPQRYAPSAKFFGKLCVIGIEDGTVYVKWLEKSAYAGLFHLTSEIDSPLLDQRVIWLSPVFQLSPPLHG